MTDRTSTPADAAANLKASAARLRQERREVKITLRGVHDDPLLLDSFGVLRTIQRRYQPLCRTVCLSSNLTDEAITRGDVESADGEGARRRKEGEDRGSRKLSAAEREAAVLTMSVAANYPPRLRDPTAFAQRTHWPAVEVEGLRRIGETFGVDLGAVTTPLVASSVPQKKEVDGSADNSCVGQKRGRGPAASSNASSVGSFVEGDSIVIAERLHSSSSSVPASPSPFHDLHSYAYGTDVGLCSSSAASIAGTFLRHAIQRQIALWGAAGALTERQSAIGNGGAAPSSPSSSSPAPLPQHPSAAQCMAAMEAIRIVPFFHEATRVASFAILIAATSEATNEREDKGHQQQQHQQQQQQQRLQLILVDPTIEVAERHLPQMLDSMRRHGASESSPSATATFVVDVSVVLTHVPRDCQLGVSAVRACVDSYAAESNTSSCTVRFAFGRIVYHSNGSVEGSDECITVPLVNSIDTASRLGVALALVPCHGYSSDSAIAELRIIAASSSSSEPSAITVAAFMPPTVGLDGLCRLDYLVEEEMAKAAAKANVKAGATAATDIASASSCGPQGEGEDAGLGCGNNAVAKASMRAAARYHASLLRVATDYLGYAVPTAEKRSEAVSTLGDGLIVFASRGGYNCSNGALEAHWATTIAEWKHQQHTRAFWAAVTGGASEAQAKKGSGGGGGGGNGSAAPLLADPFDAFVAYLDAQQYLLDPLRPPLPKLLNGPRCLRLNRAQLSTAAEDSASAAVASTKDAMLIAIDIRPVPEYLGNPTPNTANVALLPLICPPAIFYKPSATSSTHSVPRYADPAASPAPMQLGAKKPEQWLGSFVAMDSGDGLLFVVPEAEWAAARSVGSNPNTPLRLEAIAPKSLDSGSATCTSFMAALRQRLEHMGLMPYVPIATSASPKSACAEQRVWVIGHQSYAAWLAAEKEKQANGHPYVFSAAPYDHRRLRLNACEELAVMNLDRSASANITSTAAATAASNPSSDESSDNANTNTAEKKAETVAPPETIVVDIRTHAEFRNGSHRHSVHYSMWELLEDWRREHSSAWSRGGSAQLNGATTALPRWVHRFGTKAIDAGIVTAEALALAPSSSSVADTASTSAAPHFAPSIALYCAGGYRSHISASLLRSVPLSLAASGLEPQCSATTTATPAAGFGDGDVAASAVSAAAPLRPIPTYYDVAGGAFQLMTMRPDLWHVKDRSVICVS